MTASSGHGAAAKRPSKKWVIWVKRSTFLLAGAVLAGATVLALGTSPRMREAWSLINGDHGPKRWLVLKEGKPSDQSDRYRTFLIPCHRDMGNAFIRTRHRYLGCPATGISLTYQPTP